MSEAFLDTDVVVRFITGDVPAKQAAATALFRAVEAGTLTIRAPDTVIADAVYVLSSKRLYELPRERIRDELVTLCACAIYAFTTADCCCVRSTSTPRQSSTLAMRC